MVAVEAGRVHPQSRQSAGPVRFFIFCSISIFLLAGLVAGRRPQCTAGAPEQRMHSTIPIHWNIKSASASPGRSRVGPALYEFSLLRNVTSLTGGGGGQHAIQTRSGLVAASPWRSYEFEGGGCGGVIPT